MSDLLDRLQDMVDFKHDDMDVAREAIEEIVKLEAQHDEQAATIARLWAKREALQARVAELENVLRAKVTEIERAYSHEGHCIECHGVVRAWGDTEHRDDCWYVKARAALEGGEER